MPCLIRGCNHGILQDINIVIWLGAVVKIISCDTETSDIGPDLVIIETEDSGFTLLMSRDSEAEDFEKVYFDDSEILEGNAATEMIAKLEVANNLLVGESLEIYNGILQALRNAI